MSNIDPSVSIVVFIDGGYMAKVNLAIDDQFSIRINIKKLFDFLKKRIAGIYSLDYDDCHFVKCHYFRGRYRAEILHLIICLF